MTRPTRARVAALAALALAALGIRWAARGPNGRADIRLDGAAMVLVHRPGDGEARLPPDGRILTTPSGIDEWTGDTADPTRPRAVRPPGWPPGSNIAYTAEPALPAWPSRFIHAVPGSFSLDLPEGDWVLDIARGIEFVPRTISFRVARDATTTLTVSLDRWIDLPAEGWWSGDVHVHHPARLPAQRDALLDLADAQDVHVLNLLQMGHHGEWHFEPAGFGPSARRQRRDRWLIPGQEEPRGDFGHVIGLDLVAAVRDLDHQDPYVPALRKLRDQPGAVLGFAHFAWDGVLLPDGMPWLAPVCALDFVELLQFRRMGVPEYYNYLNMGFRFAAAAGSDFPWGAAIGEVRTMARSGATLDPDAWFAALRAGRTYVTNGPALELTVGGRSPGEDLVLDGTTSVTVSARARGHPVVAPLTELRVIGPSGVLAEARARATDAGDARLLTTASALTIARSQWIAAVVHAANGAVAHTSPVYVVVGGVPTWCPERGPAVIDSRLALLDDLGKRVAASADPRDRSVGPYLDEARRWYLDRRRRIVETRATVR